MENKQKMYLATSTNGTGANMIQNYLNVNDNKLTTIAEPVDIYKTDLSTEGINSSYPHVMKYSPQYLSVIDRRAFIKDVEVLVPEKVVKVTFNDNTFEKAICHPDDKFDMETGIGICIAKHFCGGGSKYNNLVNKGVKLYNAKCKAKEEAKAEQERIEAKRKKRYEKKLARKNKIKEEKRQAGIREQTEAIKIVYEKLYNVFEMLNEHNSIDNYPEPLNEE